MDVRGIQPEEPKPLNSAARNISDLTLSGLRVTAAAFGRSAAEDVATGQIDGASRYLDGDEETAAEQQHAAE